MPAWVESQLSHTLLWLRASELTSLNLNLLICKMRVIKSTTKRDGGDEVATVHNRRYNWPSDIGSPSFLLLRSFQSNEGRTASKSINAICHRCCYKG